MKPWRNWDALVEDLRFMAETRTGLLEAAARTGYTPATLKRTLIRMGQYDLLADLRAYDPIPLGAAS